MSDMLQHPRIRRDINLFDPRAWRVERPPMPWFWPFAAAGGALLLCAFMSVMNPDSPRDLAARLLALQTEIAAQEALLPVLPPLEEEARLQAQRASLQAQTARFKAETGAAPGLAALLEGLAHASVPGVWLTSIKLDRERERMELEGQAHEAARISNYLSALGQQAALSGMPEQTVVVRQREDHESGQGPEFTFLIQAERTAASVSKRDAGRGRAP